MEDLSQKIHELQEINYSIEAQLDRVQRYDPAVHSETARKLEARQIDLPQLRSLIAEKNQALEAFPRQNRNCVEYFEKYTKKFDELRGKYGN